VGVFFGNGNGTFTAQPLISTATGNFAQWVTVFDVNGDGKPDILESENSADVGYLGGNGGGTFESPVPIPAGPNPLELLAADFNGDGRLDLAVADNNSGAGGGGFVVLLNQPQTNGTTAVTVQTSPSGLQFSVDGATYTAPQTLSLSQGTHTLAAASPQPGAAGTQYAFSSWSDGGAASHSISVGASAATYTATFQAQYQLTVSASPAAGGSVTPASGSFYNAGTVVNLVATANSGYSFNGWTGAVASPSSASTTVTMSAPESLTANFATGSLSCSFTFNPPSASLPATGTSTVEPCPNNSGQPNCGVSPETPASFTVTPAAGCGAWTATSSYPQFLQVLSGAGGTGAGTVRYALLNNTHNGDQSYSITVASGGASASFPVTQAGSGDNEVYRQVYALYEQLLGRDPDPGGFAFWTGVGGAGLGPMADDFLTSPEAFNSDFAVMAAYQAATGNPPTFAQFKLAVAALRTGAQPLAALFNSLAGANLTAAMLYQNLLQRAPTGADSTCLTGGLAACCETIIGYPGSTTPMSTPNNEFQSTGSFHTDHTNALYVRMVYFVTLSRDPDPSGFSFWVGEAGTGGPGLLFQGAAGAPTRLQVLGPGTVGQGFIGSPEFQGLFAN